VCICDVVEQDTPAGPTTEFWLSVNSLNWDTIDDSEFIRYLTTFAGVDE
jgi:hypothetical protein